MTSLTNREEIKDRIITFSEPSLGESMRQKQANIDHKYPNVFPYKPILDRGLAIYLLKDVIDDTTWDTLVRYSMKQPVNYPYLLPTRTKKCKDEKNGMINFIYKIQNVCNVPHAYYYKDPLYFPMLKDFDIINITTKAERRNEIMKQVKLCLTISQQKTMIWICNNNPTYRYTLDTLKSPSDYERLGFIVAIDGSIEITEDDKMDVDVNESTDNVASTSAAGLLKEKK